MKRIAAAATLIALAAAGQAQAAKPNLRVTAVTPPPRAVGELATFKVRDAVKNAGRGRAGRSDVRYYLTSDPGRSLRERAASRSNPRAALSDILLGGSRRVPVLAGGEVSRTPRKRSVVVKVPLGTPAGEYFLLACADDRGAVAESKEADNCVASKRAAGVSAPPGPGLDVNTFMEWAQDKPDAEEAQDMATTKPYTCMPVRGGKGSLSLKRALAGIDRFLAAKAPQGLAQFKKTPEYRNANRAEAAAAGALLAGSPGAALAAMTRAHRLEPKEASHLIGAAAMATAVGLPREALALLDASVRLDDRVPGAWGMSRQAVVLANRAQALAALGRFAEAEQAADAARAIEPTLAEASSTASTAALCRDKIPVAVARRKEARRRTPPGQPPAGPDVPIEAGFEHELRKLDLPGFPGQSPRLFELYESQLDRRSADNQRLGERTSQLEAILRAKDVHPLEERQAGRIMSAMYRVHRAPDLEAQQQQRFDLLDEIGDLRRKFFCGGSTYCSADEHVVTGFREEASAACTGAPEDWETCYTREMRSRCVPALHSYHQEWLAKMEEAYRLADAYHREESRRQSAIAAHLKDPDRHALALLRIAGGEDGVFFNVQLEAHAWTRESDRLKEYCIESEDPSVAVQDDQPDAVTGQPCPDSLKSVNALLDVGPAQLKFSCEQIQLAGNLGEGWVKGFGELTYDYRANKISVFAGSQGEIGKGLKADFKSGLYITVDNQGVQDAGWRVGPSVTVGGGPAEFNPSDMVDISFVGIFSGPGG